MIDFSVCSFCRDEGQTRTRPWNYTANSEPGAEELPPAGWSYDASVKVTVCYGRTCQIAYRQLRSRYKAWEKARSEARQSLGLAAYFNWLDEHPVPGIVSQEAAGT